MNIYYKITPFFSCFCEISSKLEIQICTYNLKIMPMDIFLVLDYNKNNL